MNDAGVMLLFTLLPTIVGFIVVTVLITWTLLSNPTRHFLNRHDANVRYYYFDSRVGKITGFDSKDMGSLKTSDLSDFAKQFDFGKGIGEGRRVADWLNALLKANSAPLYYRTSAFFNSHRQKKEILLIVTNINREKGIVHFESRILPNISLAKYSSSGDIRHHFLTYGDYLRRFRGILSRKRLTWFFYVGLVPNPQSIRFVSEKSQKDYIMTLLADRLAEHLFCKDGYIVLLDNLSMLFISFREFSDENAKRTGANIREMVLSFLLANGLEDHYSIKIGLSCHRENTSIKVLRDYVNESQEASEGDSGKGLPPIFDSSLKLSSVQDNRVTAIKKIITKDMWRIYYKPIFNLINGFPVLYELKVIPFGYELGGNSIDDFLGSAWRYGLLKDLANRVIKDVMARANYTAASKNILVPMRLAYVDTLSQFNAKWPSNIKLSLAFFEKDIAIYEGPKLQEILQTIGRLGIGVYLMLDGTGGLDDKTVKMFSGLIIKRSPGPVWTADDRLNTLVTINSLRKYGKPIAVNGLMSEDECYFVKAYGVDYAYSPALCPPSSYPETLDSDGKALIVRLNQSHVLQRF